MNILVPKTAIKITILNFLQNSTIFDDFFQFSSKHLTLVTKSTLGKKYQVQIFFSLCKKNLPKRPILEPKICIGRLEILFLHNLDIFLWPPPKSMTNDVYLTPIEENLH